MDGFIDRLADLLKTLWGTGSSGTGSRGGAGSGSAGAGAHRQGGFVDPDVQAAWEELDEYMRTGSNSTADAGQPRGAGPRTRRPPSEELRQDYANLEVPFGADIETVRASYKRLMLKYHPDRFAGDAEKQKVALEIAKKINQSFQKIRDHQEA